jgi:hypothetical protein
VSAWQNGAISQNTLFENLKAGEIVADTETFEDEQARIDDAAAQFAAQQATVYPQI